MPKGIDTLAYSQDGKKTVTGEPPCARTCTNVVKWLMLAALVLASCDSAAPVKSPTATSSQTVGATACRTNDEVTEVLRGFFASFNAADFDDIERTLSSRFESYSLTLAGEHFVARDRSATVAALRSRHEAGDRFRFAAVRVSELDAWDGAAHFGYLDVVLVREGREHRMGGKGALYCRGEPKGIKVMALGAPE
jgi:hypothetical protein